MARNYEKEYANYHSRPEQKKKRASRNKVRRAAVASGRAKKGDNRDVHHVDGNPLNNSPKNLRVVSRNTNRSFPRTATARKA
mgnify:CR=1 FL=1|tara:strand:- start:47 stop:292 length:246 start_codon:yes stop_codon:yes gene_type:complete